MAFISQKIAVVVLGLIDCRSKFMWSADTSLSAMQE